MSYWNTTTDKSNVSLDNWALNQSSIAPPLAEFYELEPAVVLDIILDKNHPELKDKFIDAQNWPADENAIVTEEFSAPSSSDTDFSWAGKALVRPIHSSKNFEKEQLIWAYPLENNISEYPLVNEIVLLVKYLDRYFYTRKINNFNFTNNNVDFNLELEYGGYYVDKDGNRQVRGNRETIYDYTNPQLKDYVGPISNTRLMGGYGFQGAMGRYFFANQRIRSLKRREGDLILESRFGQSIRFGSYDDNRDNDKGYNDNFKNGYPDYRGHGVMYDFTEPDGKVKPYEAGGGNPMILIRNRQRPLAKEDQQIKNYINLPPVVGTEEEKNVGGFLLEDVNNDGTSIHLTSGATISGFKTNCSKLMWGNGEEQKAFNPTGSTMFRFPILSGDQIVINSDRVVISSKANETFHYSKKRYSVVTDSEYTVDSHDQMILTTNNKTVINSPAIYLGEYGVTDEPALLGQTTVNWLYDLCNWMLNHTHWYKHGHKHHYSEAVSDKTQFPVEVQQLIELRDKLKTLLSRRVFLTGGGFAPGKNGEPLKGNEGTPPVKINTKSGEGVPGGWKGQNRRKK